MYVHTHTNTGQVLADGAGDGGEDVGGLAVGTVGGSTACRYSCVITHCKRLDVKLLCKHAIITGCVTTMHMLTPLKAMWWGRSAQERWE